MLTAAERGLPHAQLLLGLMYKQGEGVPKDDKEAEKWIRKAADQGLGLAQSILAELEQQGR